MKDFRDSTNLLPASSNTEAISLSQQVQDLFSASKSSASMKSPIQAVENPLGKNSDAAPSQSPGDKTVASSTFTSDLHNTTILLMRHAEKPDSGSDLSPAGYDRANALATYIPQEFGKPDYLFAARDSAQSDRPVETLTPLSTATGVPIDSQIADKKFAELAKELENDPNYAGKFIVIDWHHGNIPGLAQDLGAPAGTYPNRWPSKDFNDMLEFTFDANGTPTVKEIPEQLNGAGNK